MTTGHLGEVTHVQANAGGDALGHLGEVTHVQANAGGDALVSASSDGTARLWSSS
ncbi:hypothetical protein T484DRAFT_1869328 [Baffinella frigidus]|nr:hypothetical protein T484DRAFT_1869328 [Cryptophyta sp. CCMP2293]